MVTLENVIYPTQKKLFNRLKKRFYRTCVSSYGDYILVKGEAPIMLVAHLDTVHKTSVKTICKNRDKTVWMSPEGIGGDDRCGVYAILKAYESVEVKPWLLFTCDEEVGCLGAGAFADDFETKKYLPKGLKKLKCIIEIDRRGSDDAVFYDCDNADFEAYINSKGFKTALGSFSDICHIAPELGVAAVNLSSGYYNAHTEHEFIVVPELERVVEKVIEIVRESTGAEFPRYEYVEKEKLATIKDWSYSGYYEDVLSDFYDVPSDLNDLEKRAYVELLDYGYRDRQELEDLRAHYGNDFLLTLYEIEMGEPIEEDDEDALFNRV
jgi:hypothetical protein